MKKLLLIYNPVAGKQQFEKKLPEITGIFEAAGFMTEVYRSSFAGDAKERVQHGPGADRIVCAGGDGTLREVITGLQLAGLKTPLGYIPCGSTNDFGVSLGLSTDILTAAKTAAESEPVPVDIGFFQDSFFSYVASFGAFTAASYSAPQKLKNKIGHLAYILQGIRDVKSMKPYHLALSCEESEFEGDFFMGAFSNSTSVAGILTLDQTKVSLRDGYFEVLLISYTRSPFKLAKIVGGLLTQRYDGQLIRFFSTKALRFRSDASFAWTLDGEKHEGVAEGEAHVVPAALQMVLPKG